MVKVFSLHATLAEGAARRKSAEQSGAGRPRRAAVCLCGLFRDHFHHIHPSMHEALLNLQGVEVDVFVEAWADRCVSSVDQLSAYPNLTSFKMEKLPTGAGWAMHGLAMPPSYREIFNPRPAVHMAVRARQETLRRNMLSVLPSLWKMRRCSLAIEEWEMASNFTYDAIIKARPDGAFWYDDKPQGVFSVLPQLARHVAHGGCLGECLYHFLDHSAVRVRV